MACTKVDTKPLPLAIIGRDTWSDIVDYRPGLAPQSNRKLFAWSVWGGHLHHNESEHGRAYERVAVPSRRLAGIEGNEREHAQKRYVGRNLLDTHAAVMPGFQYTGWRMGNHPRQIDHDGLDVTLVERLKQDLLLPVADLGPAIDLWTGLAVENPTSGRGAVLRRARAEQAAAEADRRSEDALCDEQRALLAVLNETPSNAPAGLVGRNAQVALEVAATVGPKPGVTSSLRHGLRAMMDTRRLQYQPFTPYAPSPHGRTVRVHPVVHPSVVSLRRQVRRATLAGCLGFDLRNCQLACAGAAWGVVPLIDLLVRDGTAWNHLLGIVRRHHGGTEAEAKSALKTAIYALVFGMGRNGVRLSLGRALSFTAASAFENDPIVAALFERRDEALAEIDAADGARDCFGVWYPVRPGRDREAECRSALAATMQAQELRLLLPVVEDAARVAALHRPQYRIVAWQHDGFYVKVRTDADGVARRLASAVQREADRLGVPTGLDVERL